MISFSDCMRCKHFHLEIVDQNSCDAFDTIPPDIITGKVSHYENVPGDKGIKFEPKEKEGKK